MEQSDWLKMIFGRVRVSVIKTYMATWHNGLTFHPEVPGSYLALEGTLILCIGTRDVQITHL